MEVGYLGKRTLLARSPVNISPVTAPSHTLPLEAQDPAPSFLANLPKEARSDDGGQDVWPF